MSSFTSLASSLSQIELSMSPQASNTYVTKSIHY
jgi:hypothetical protein